jgi:Sec-independent protein translocase protein TatA
MPASKLKVRPVKVYKVHRIYPEKMGGCPQGLLPELYIRIMFGQIGTTELLVIAMVVLIVLGPKQIPIVMKKAGKIYREFNILKKNLMDQINSLENSDESPPEEEKKDE